MSAEEKKIAQNIIDAVNVLPDEKREYILGFAEGVLAMAGRRSFPERTQDSA